MYLKNTAAKLAMKRTGLIFLLFYFCILNCINAQLAYDYYQKGIEFYKTHEYEEAARLFEIALINAELEYGTESANYLLYQNLFASVLVELQEYSRAEKIFLEIMEKINAGRELGISFIVSFKNNFAKLLIKLGRFKEAEELYIELTELVKDDEELYGSVLNNLRAFYELTGEKEKLDKLSEIETNYDGIDYANRLINISSRLFDENKLEESKTKLEEAISVINKTVGSNHPLLSSLYNNLAIINKNLGFFDEAEKNYLLSLAIKEKISKRQPGYIYTKFNLAELYVYTGNYDKAARIYSEAKDGILDLIENFFPSLSEKERTQFWTMLKNRADNYYSFAAFIHKEKPDILKDILSFRIATKALLLSSSSNIRKQMLATNDKALNEKYKTLRGYKDSLSVLYRSSEDEEKNYKKIIEIEAKVNSLEKELSAVLKLNNLAVNDKLESTELYRCLSAEESIVELIRFERKDDNGTSVSYYIALIVKNDSGIPRAVIFENGNFLETKALTYYQRAIRSKLRDEHSFNNFWAPIQNQLGDTKKVYFSPDGVYNLISIPALQKSDNSFVIDSTEIIWITNPKSVLTIKDTSLSKSNITDAALFGAPQYYIREKSGVEYASEKEQLTVSLKERKPQNLIDRILIENIYDLHGTLKEVEKISQILKNKSVNTQIFLNSNAGEDELKKIKAPSILHIATHGYFLPEFSYDDSLKSILGMNREKLAQNPLLRSGLFLSGVKNADHINNQDGIFTAFEASNLDLRNTGLVILSACETGLGDIQNGEGVYGLSRAFLNAGAKGILLSLWKVDDTATQNLMTLFYEEFVSNWNLGMALRSAQLKIKEKYHYPYFWGGFIHFEN